MAVFRKRIVAPYALLPLLYLFVSIFDEHRAPGGLISDCRGLGKLSMPLWLIRYVFFVGYVNAIVPLFDIDSSERVGMVIVLLALVMCIPVMLIYHFVFSGVRRGVQGIHKAGDSSTSQ